MHQCRNIRNFTARLGKPIYCLVYGRDNEDVIKIKIIRGVISFFLGMLLSYLLWLLVSLSFDFRQLFRHYVPDLPLLYMYLIINATIFALSRNMRAITLLIFVALMGKTGRSYLRALAFAMIIAGPIDNLVRNAGEVARVFSCTTILTYNLTKTRVDLMAKPFTNTLQHMKQDVEEIQDNFKELQAILSELKYNVEHVDAAMEPASNKSNITLMQPLPQPAQAQARFVRNMSKRCKQQLNSGHRVCQQVFRQGYRKCATNFPSWLAQAICWPYRIDIICKINLFGNPDKVCNASKVVPADFGDNYVQLLSTERQLYGNSSGLEISYKLQNASAAKAQLRSAQQTQRQFTEDFQRRKRIFQFVMKLLEKLLCFFILRVIWSSLRYFALYRGNVEFDNNYLTDYFKHLDARMRQANKPVVLPLHNYERKRYVDVAQLCSRSGVECSSLIYNLLQLLLELFTSCLFLLLDVMVVRLMRIIRSRSLITYKQEGEHEIRFSINGTGLMARLLRTTMRNFNIHERVSTSLSNEECLPVAHALPSSFYAKLCLLYLLILLLIWKSTTLLRLRPFICSYFYYKREKQRILFLYNSIRRERLSMLHSLRRMGELNLAARRIEHKLNICLRLRLGFPGSFGWLQRFRCARRLCLICSVLEVDGFFICFLCSLAYCQECCTLIRNICIQCEYEIRRSSADENHSDETSVELYSYRKEK
ncbi:snky [Drosophila busckii]|uniref:Snky n=1 Tax=Drosophila busckii TaxID=30019 RepID=A0A0M4F133_DROBS|nr:protein sneaky [Drosophila busckii]ALC44557.1 snky [Drosophila busckii]